jgi:hypothetical protein
MVSIPLTSDIFSVCLLMPSMLLAWLVSALDSLIKAVVLFLATSSLASASDLMISASLSAEILCDLSWAFAFYSMVKAFALALNSANFLIFLASMILIYILFLAAISLTI